MNEEWQRTVAIVLLAAIGLSIIVVMGIQVGAAAKSADASEAAAWFTAGFLSVREVISKIEQVALGGLSPAKPAGPTDGAEGK